MINALKNIRKVKKERRLPDQRANLFRGPKDKNPPFTLLRDERTAENLDKTQTLITFHFFSGPAAVAATAAASGGGTAASGGGTAASGGGTVASGGGTAAFFFPLSSSNASAG